MAAGLGFKTFVTGDILTANDTNGYLMQGVLVFADATARDAAITAPAEGQFAYLKDTDVTTYYTGAAWATPSSGGMTLISTFTADNTSTTFTTSSISSSYKQLIAVGTGLQSSSTQNTLYFRFNGDTSGNYVARALGFAAGGTQNYDPSGDVTGNIYRTMARSTDTVNRFGSFWLNIYNLQETDAYKGFAYNAGCSNDGSFGFFSSSGFWKNSADPITTISIYSSANIALGSIKLYGVS